MKIGPVTLGAVLIGISGAVCAGEKSANEAGANAVQTTSVADREEAARTTAAFVAEKGWNWGKVMEVKGPFDFLPKEGLPEKFWTVTFEKRVPVKVFGGIGDTPVKASAFVGKRTGAVKLPQVN